MKDYVVRINLKPVCKSRKDLIDFCLNQEEQYLAIGWSSIYNSAKQICDYNAYYEAIKSTVKRINPVINLFGNAEENDLFWTRDLDGNYWICRVTGKAKPCCREEMDVGAVLPVKAYKVGLEVPGKIKASFNRPRGGTAEKLSDKLIVEYSKFIFNQKSGSHLYDYEPLTGNVLDNLPDFELEELVISYLQVKENYYVLSNSIANKSTTVKIECELILRDKLHPQKAVVQVKGGKDATLDSMDFKPFWDNGYLVYLYAPFVTNVDKAQNVIEISKQELEAFFHEYKSLLPNSIVKWENLFDAQA